MSDDSVSLEVAGHEAVGDHVENTGAQPLLPPGSRVSSQFNMSQTWVQRHFHCTASLLVQNLILSLIISPVRMHYQ